MNLTAPKWLLRPGLPSRSRLALNTWWMFAGQGMRLVIQAAYFTVIARSLGAANYGAFVGVAAFVGIAFPFGALGSGNLLIRDVARDSTTFSKAWGAALLRTTIFSSALVGLVIVLAHFALPPELPRRLILLIALADIVGMNLTLLSAFAFQALERLVWTSGIYVGLSTSRLIAALLLVALHPHPTALEWSYAYIGSTAFIALVAFAIAAAKLGLPSFSLRNAKADLREGLFFASSLSAQTIYNDLDKTMLARLGTLEATGVYGAAYRVVEVSFAPVTSLLSAAYPNFFRVGSQGIAGSLRFAMPLLRKAFLFSLVICVGLMLCAGLLPKLLGSQYIAAAIALRWLALILPLRSVHAFLCDVLTSVGRQGLRTGIQVCVGLGNGLLNLWAIPAYSWKGAVFSSLVSDACLALAVGSAVWVLARRAARQSGDPSGPVGSALDGTEVFMTEERLYESA